jgi:hypothetical protein
MSETAGESSTSNEGVSLRDVPLSAPVWLWVAYGVVLVVLSVTLGTPAGVMFTAAFSFQFWTFAAWRGQRRNLAARRGEETKDE